LGKPIGRHRQGIEHSKGAVIAGAADHWPSAAAAFIPSHAEKCHRGSA
jgi:hypothetical protein